MTYSNTPLAKKLGIKEGHRILLYQEPWGYFKLFDYLPEDLVQLKVARKDSADFIHLFLTQENELMKSANRFKTALKKDGVMWVSWPKGSSSIEKNINRESVREAFLKAGLVDIKVASIDEDWSGLKFVYRLTDR